MPSIQDLLSSLFPHDTDDEINAKIQSVNKSPEVQEVLKNLLPSPDAQTDDQSVPPKTDTSDLTVNPDITTPQSSPANSTQSSFDVNESTSPVTMKGAMPSVPTGNIPQPDPSLISPTPQPTPPLPITPSAVSSQIPTTTVGKSNSVSPSPAVGNAPLAQNLSDNDERQKMLTQEEQKRKIGILPILAGGAGDAIGNAATVFGAKEGTPVLDSIVDMESKNIDKDKAQFEENLKNDPSSDVSKSYQKVLGMMMGKPATDPGIQKMSASTIASQLPEVEKFMAKEISLKQIQATKQLAQSQQASNEQDKLEQQARQGLQSIRGDASVRRVEEQRDAAITAYNRLDEIQKSGKGLNPVDYTDILGQIYKARTGQAPGDQVLSQIRQQTAKGSLDKAYTYITGQQAPATTQDIANSLKGMAQSMGQQADKLHAGYMQTHGEEAFPSRLSPEQKERYGKLARGTSFAEATGASSQPSSQGASSQMTATNPKTGARIKSNDGGQTWQPM